MLRYLNKTKQKPSYYKKQDLNFDSKNRKFFFIVLNEKKNSTNHDYCKYQIIQHSSNVQLVMQATVEFISS